MRQFQPAKLLLLCLLSLAGCGDGHDHNDHSHKDHDHGHGDGHKDHGHDHSGPNPHVWLVPSQVINWVHPVATKLDQVIAVKDGKPVIVVTIFPLQSLVEQIVGDDAIVKTLIAPGASPHGFEVKAHHLKMLREADVLLTIGLKFDEWAEKAMRETHPDREPTILQFAKLVEKPTGGKLSKKIEDRRQELLIKLNKLDLAYREKLADVKTKQLVTFHNAFDLLAKRYGMEVVTHLTEIELSHGGEVPPKQLKAAREAVTKYKLKVLYSEPQFPDVAMQAIREATNVAILRLDPIGNPNVEGYRDYFEMMESNLKTLMDGQSR